MVLSESTQERETWKERETEIDALAHNSTIRRRYICSGIMIVAYTIGVLRIYMLRGQF